MSELEEDLTKIIDELKILLLPKDLNDDKNVIVEIRGGAGGDEAALFAGVLFRMYSMYAANRRWRVELMSSNETGIGGYKEVVFMITGKGAYSRLKFESGVHRVQRVPETESQGRIHTSTVTVAADSIFGWWWSQRREGSDCLLKTQVRAKTWKLRYTD